VETFCPRPPFSGLCDPFTPSSRESRVSDDILQTINFAVKGSLVAAHVKAHNVPYIAAGGSKNATL
jgi:hypothetical protein